MKNNIDPKTESRQTTSVSKTYPYPQENNHVSSIFENMLTALTGAEVDKRYILDIYADLCTDLEVQFDMLCWRYIGTAAGCVVCGTDIGSEPRVNVFRNAVQEMRRMLALDFLREYHAYTLKAANNSGVENGYLYESFLESLPSGSHAVFLDPPPHFVSKLGADSRYPEKAVSIFFTDARVATIYRFAPTVQHLLRDVPESVVHALVFAEHIPPAGLNAHLTVLNNLVANATQLVIQLYLPNIHVDGKKVRRKAHRFLLNAYSIPEIKTIGASAFRTLRNVHSVITLLDKSKQQKSVIPIHRIHHIKENGRDELSAVAAVNVQTELFLKGNKSIASLISDATQHPVADTENTDSPQARMGALGPCVFNFSNEIIGYGSVTIDRSTEPVMYRAKMNPYGKPDARQINENRDGRGSALLREAVNGRRHKTPEEARDCAYELLEHVKIRQAVCDDLKGRVHDPDFSLYSFWYLFRDKLDKKEDKFAVRFFFHQADLWSKYHKLPVLTCNEQDILRIIEEAANTPLHLTRRIISLLSCIFTYAVRQKYRTDNPCAELLEEICERVDELRNLRDSLGLRSQTMEQNKRLVKYLLSQKGTDEHGLAIGALICVLTGMETSEVCPLPWESYSHVSSVDIYQFVLNWKSPGTETELKKSEKARRCVPLCNLLSEEIKEWKERQTMLLAEDPEKTLPIVTRTVAGKQKPISQRDLTNYLRNLIDDLGIEPQTIPVPVGDGSMRDHNLSKYHGSWFRANFDYCARIEAKMPIDDLNYMLGRQLRSTDARHYRDYQKDLRQLALKVIVDRWAEQLRPETIQLDDVLHRLEVPRKENFTLQGATVPVRRFIMITTPEGKPDEVIKFSISARHGLTSNIPTSREVA